MGFVITMTSLLKPDMFQRIITKYLWAEMSGSPGTTMPFGHCLGLGEKLFDSLVDKVNPSIKC
jgi:hypothetical protein